MLGLTPLTPTPPFYAQNSIQHERGVNVGKIVSKGLPPNQPKQIKAAREDTHKKWGGRTTKVRVPTSRPQFFIFFRPFFPLLKKFFFANWFRGFNPPPHLSGSTTKKNIFVCVNRGAVQKTYFLSGYDMTKGVRGGFMHEKNIFLLICPLRPRGGGS